MVPTYDEVMDAFRAERIAHANYVAADKVADGRARHIADLQRAGLEIAPHWITDYGRARDEAERLHLEWLTLSNEAAVKHLAYQDALAGAA